MSLCRKIHLILALITMFSFVSCSENENMEVKIVNEPSEDVLSREALKGNKSLKMDLYMKVKWLLEDQVAMAIDHIPMVTCMRAICKKHETVGTHRYKSDKLLERYVGMWANDEWDGWVSLFLRIVLRLRVCGIVQIWFMVIMRVQTGKCSQENGMVDGIN